MSLKREIRDFQKFQELPREEKEVIFYSESINYYPYLEGLIGGLDSVSYITSDPNDVTKDFYLNRLLPLFMVLVNCKVLVMTMTDLNLFHIRRSIHPVHYVYVFHSLASTHMIYRERAFDYYDSILCVGPHQVEEIRKREQLYKLKPKKLIRAGYYRLEQLYEAYKKHNKESKEVTVLVAPTWGDSNLLNWCGKELLEILLDKGYRVILRLHPETVKRHQFLTYKGVTLETSVVSMNSLVKADILITDWSGIGLKYAFGTERPVVYIDTPPKVRNLKYKGLGIEPLESYLRNEIGVTTHLDNIRSVNTIIQETLNNRNAWKDKLSRLRNEYVFNFGRSSEVGVSYIKELL